MKALHFTSHLTGLWRHPDFMRLWTGQTISQFGSIVTRDALPLAAVITLNASPAQMGFLASLGMAPLLLVSLFAGVWVDRARRKPLMIAADLGRAGLVASIPLAYLLGWLRIEQLYVVAFLAGALSVIFEVAYRSYLPGLVSRERLVEGNSKLGLSDSVAEIGGSAVAGLLVQAVTAPFAILIDAFSFLISALFLGRIRAAEPPLQAVEHPATGFQAAVTAGLGQMAVQPTLRALAGGMATLGFFGGFFGALYSLYLVRVLDVSPAVLGLLIASGGAGALLGAAVNTRLTGSLGLNRTLVLALGLTGALSLLVPLAAGPAPLILGMLLLGQVAGDLARTIFFINAVTLRQTITSDRWLGRVNAAFEFTTGGAAMVGLLLGGLLAEITGPRGALWIAAAGELLAVLWLLPLLKTSPTGMSGNGSANDHPG